MQPPTISFAPLAGRLAAHVAAIRPAEGARVSVAMLMALFFCAIFEGLIRLCEALDARAAAEALAALAAPRDVAMGSVPVSGAGRQAPSGERRAALRLALTPMAEASAPEPTCTPRKAVERPIPAAPRLVWSRDPGPIRAAHAPPWRERRETRVLAPA